MEIFRKHTSTLEIPGKFGIQTLATVSKIIASLLGYAAVWVKILCARDSFCHQNQYLFHFWETAIGL